MWFEDFEVGDTFVTKGRTVTETDVMMYAYLSGDYNPIHTDAVFASQTQWLRPLAHGPLVTLIGAGLRARLGLLDGTAVALLGIQCNFVAPVFPGDTVKVHIEVKSVRRSRTSDHGIIEFALNTRNQRDETVQTGEAIQMVRRRNGVTDKKG